MKKIFSLACAISLCLSLQGSILNDVVESEMLCNPAWQAQVTRVYNDAVRHDLRGNVKSAAYVYSGDMDEFVENVEFNADGSQKFQYNKDPMVYDVIDRVIKRDGKGRVVYEKTCTLAEGGEKEYLEYIYEYNADGKLRHKMIKTPGTSDAYVYHELLSYDEKGQVKSNKQWSGNDTSNAMVISYRYVSKDAHGNWTERNMFCNGEPNGKEKRTITYF